MSQPRPQGAFPCQGKAPWGRGCACRLFSRGVIFTRARVSLALLSLKKNGDYSYSNLRTGVSRLVFRKVSVFQFFRLTWYNSLWLWRWLPKCLSKVDVSHCQLQQYKSYSYSISILAIRSNRRQETVSMLKYCLKWQNWTIIFGVQLMRRHLTA